MYNGLNDFLVFIWNESGLFKVEFALKRRNWMWDTDQRINFNYACLQMDIDHFKSLDLKINPTVSFLWNSKHALNFHSLQIAKINYHFYWKCGRRGGLLTVQITKKIFLYSRKVFDRIQWLELKVFDVFQTRFYEKCRILDGKQVLCLMGNVAVFCRITKRPTCRIYLWIDSQNYPFFMIQQQGLHCKDLYFILSVWT